MREMCEAMRDIAELPSRPQIYWPVHPSPRVRPVAREILGDVDGVVLVEPIDYAQMVAAVKGRRSSSPIPGLARGAPCLGKPVLVMRDETERPEGLQAGTLALVGHQRAKIVEVAAELLAVPEVYARMARRRIPTATGMQASG